MSTFTFSDQVIEIEDIETGIDGRVYGDPRTVYGRPLRVASVTNRVVTTPFCECHDLYDALHDDDGCELEDVIIRITFDLSIDHEPATRDYPGYDGRETNITKVEVLQAATETTDGVLGIFYHDSDVAAVGCTLFADTLEGHEPDPIPEADHPRI